MAKAEMKAAYGSPAGSEPLTAALRELHAVPRSFRTVRGAMLWYAAQRARRQGRAINLEAVGAPRSQASLDEAEATYAKLCACLTVHDAADLDPDFGLYPLRLAHLLVWYRAERSQQHLADEMGLTLRELSKYCAFTESVLRRRMRERGLIDG